MAKRPSFDWEGGLPVADLHSDAKLRLLALYLDRYFDTVAAAPQIDRLSISFVDGFSGGGLYKFKEGERYGSPFVILQAVKKASERLNRNRRKPLMIDARYYFVDASSHAVGYLRDLIEKSEFAEIYKADHIRIFNGEFEALCASIVDDIRGRHSAGRSVFVLDQKGWSAVSFDCIRSIISGLPRSEAILTFAIDWLIAYLNEGEFFKATVLRLGISDGRLREYLRAKGEAGARYIIPRLMLQDIQALTGASFVSPFFLRSRKSGRDLWIVHLSKIATARNVMVSSHWDISNAASWEGGGIGASSLHQGNAGLNMLGFDPHWEDALPLDFAFDEAAGRGIHAALVDGIPYSLERYDMDDPPTIDEFLSGLANNSAATRVQFEDSIRKLHDEGVIDVLTPSAAKKRIDAKLTKADRIRISKQMTLPGIKLPGLKKGN